MKDNKQHIGDINNSNASQLNLTKEIHIENIHDIISNDVKYWETIKEQLDKKDDIKLKTLSNVMTISAGILAIMVSFGEYKFSHSYLFPSSMILCCVCILSGLIALFCEIALCKKAIDKIEENEINHIASIYFNKKDDSKKIIKLPRFWCSFCEILCWSSLIASISILTYILL